MNATMYTLIIIVVWVGITGFLVWKLNKYRSTKAYQKNDNWFLRFLKQEEKFFLKIETGFSNLIKRINLEKIISSQAIEIILLGVWAFWVGREYLNFNPYMWPIGREFGVQVISHNFWNQVIECGSCALWNGSINGGFPALADTFGSAFHPLVMISTLLFGIVNGVKVATILSLWIMGISQWGIAHLLGARRAIRVWSGALAIVGGHILGRLELGAFGLILSTSMAVLTILSLMNFIKKRTKGSMLFFASSITLLLLSGHGYFQLAILSWLVIVFLLVIIKQPAAEKRKFAVALVLGVLIACVVIIPILHFSQNVDKWHDDTPSINQKVEYIPLNLVIHDWDFYINKSLEKSPFPYLTNIYIGWVPVILAILALALPKDEKKPYLSILASCVLFFLFLASGIPFRWAAKIFPFISGIRHFQLISGLMVPAIIGLASFSAEQLLSLEWPTFNLSYTSGKSVFTFPGRWLLFISLVFSIYSSYEFNHKFIELKNTNDVYQIISKVPETDSQWMATPYGEHWWVLPAIEHNLKVTDVIYPWWWKNRVNPKPYLQMTQSNPMEGMVTAGVINNFPIYTNSDNLYAYVDTGENQLPCKVTSNGGVITAYCRTIRPGQLVIKEHNWNGWKAWRDGRRIMIRNDNWISVDAIGGEHIYTFRYIPWDVYLGLALSGIGIFLSIYIWFSSSPIVENILHGKKPKSTKK